MGTGPLYSIVILGASMLIRVSLKTQNVSDRAPNGGHAVSICKGPPKKNSDFYLNIWPEAQHICVLGRLAGKTR